MEAVRGISRNVIEDRDEKAVRAVEKVEFSSDAMAGETARFSRGGETRTRRTDTDGHATGRTQI